MKVGILLTFSLFEISKSFVVSENTGIYNYGCWCYFDENWSDSGPGVPVDPTDELCRNHTLSLKNLIDNGSCGHRFWEIDYQKASSENDIDNECQELNSLESETGVSDPSCAIGPGLSTSQV